MRLTWRKAAAFPLLWCAASTALQAPMQGGDVEAVLQRVHDISTNDVANLCYHRQFESAALTVATDDFASSVKQLSLVSAFVTDSRSLEDNNVVASLLRSLWLANTGMLQVRAAAGASMPLVTSSNSRGIHYAKEREAEEKEAAALNILSDGHFEDGEALPWLQEHRRLTSSSSAEFLTGAWTRPFFSCARRAWLMSFVAPVSYSDRAADPVVGSLSFDVDVSHFDINQCEDEKREEEAGPSAVKIKDFSGTHKCHRQTSKCVFEPGNGWIKGGYRCHCLDGFFSRTDNPSFNGSLVEVAWRDESEGKSDAYSLLYECVACADGCGTCVDAAPCLAEYNWTFRCILLGISVVCALFTLGLMCLVVRFRRLKVFSLASPTFLCITLLGCAVMYAEMVAIFPYLDTYFCIATKWSRNLGFLITYSALLMKTWRVSLTFRVKSAHKLKLTDKQLLQWLFPIFLVMVIYLAAWTLSDPPQAVFITDYAGLKFKQCHYGWWDNSLALGELLFLLWGIKICFDVRKARTYFDEAKLIRWSIYNIALVNILMLAIHVIIFPDAGPDMKYFFGFVRTQLGTSVTIMLIFGPKFVRVYRGTANELEEGGKGSNNMNLSIYGVPLEDVEEKDVNQENEELKDEIQKLAAQIQYLKIVGMLSDNRHIKSKKDGYFNKENCAKQMEQFQQYLLKNGWVNAASGPTSLAPTSLVQRTQSHGPLTSAAARFCPEHHVTREQTSCSCAEVETSDCPYNH